jgi:hypothetical protein
VYKITGRPVIRDGRRVYKPIVKVSFGEIVSDVQGPKWRSKTFHHFRDMRDVEAFIERLRTEAEEAGLE